VLDSIFTARLIRLLKMEEKQGIASSEESMTTRLQAIQAEKVKQSSSVNEQLVQVSNRMMVLRRNLDLEADTKMLQAWASELKDLANTEVALQEILDKVDATVQETLELNSLLIALTRRICHLSYAEKTSLL
jgi:hypothetical protein